MKKLSILSLFLLVALTLVVQVPAHAFAPVTVERPGFDRESELDKVFEGLAQAKSAAEARPFIGQFWKVAMTAPDQPTADLLHSALRARSEFNLDKALKIIDRVVENQPSFAEGWNQRATLHYMKGNFDQAIRDCEVTLSLVPRHIGCLSGSAIILIRHLKRYDLGKRILDEAIRLHPQIYEKVLLKELPPSL